MSGAGDWAVDVAIIGFHKCATTSLLEMLAQHPDLTRHPGGQWPFFLREDDYAQRYPEVMLEQFGHRPRGSRVLVRDDTLALDPRALARLAELSPRTVLVLSMRDPAERALSAYSHAVGRGLDIDCGFDEVLRQGTDRFVDPGTAQVTNYLGGGLYHQAIRKIELIYPSRQLVLLRSADLAVDPVTACRRVFAAADLAPYDVEPRVANQAAVLRSRRFGQLLRRDSALKSALRSVLPPAVRIRGRTRLAALNAKQVERPSLTPQQRAALDEFYAEDLKRLRRDYDVDLH